MDVYLTEVQREWDMCDTETKQCCKRQKKSETSILKKKTYSRLYGF